MKKAFLLIAALALLASCTQPTDEDTSKITFTVRNQSSYDLSAVKWVDASFASNNSGDLLIGASSTKEVVEDTAYIYFTRKDIGIELRTDQIYSQSDLSATITDNTVVIEVGNVSNRGILKEIILQPKLTVERNALSVAKNDVVNIGESTTNAVNPFKFTIKNTGRGTLTFTGSEPVKSSDAAFTVVQPTDSKIAMGSSLDFTINFKPLLTQVYNTTVIIGTNDPDGNFSFTITGRGVAPKPILKIFQGDTEIAQSGTLNMGEIIITQPSIIEIILKNVGQEVLVIDTANIAINGADAAAFTKLTNPSANISPEGESRFTIQCNPTEQGENNAILTIPTNDNSRNPAIVYLKATGKLGSAVMELSQGETLIANNGLTPFDFGQVEIGSNKPLVFTIKNTGNIPLQLSGTPKVESSNTAVFTISTQPAASSIASGETTSFIVSYAPQIEGDNTAEITILNNSASLQFTFHVKGNGYAKKPQITLSHDTTSIENHGEYDFGVVEPKEPKSVVFTIGNSGDAALTFITVDNNRINLTDNAAGLFSITQQPASTNVTPGNTTSFTVRFSPVSEGNFSATVTIRTNSKTDDEFTFAVNGTGDNPYNIGDIGPAGGRIFYDKGTYSNGWRYLEAAPLEAESSAPWGANRETVGGTGVNVGEGKENTRLIVEKLKQLGETGKAAQSCDALAYGGYTDWFLPSKGEIDLMDKNLKGKGLGGFTSIYYWSSSESSSINAWRHYFGKGTQDTYAKPNTLLVRAARAF